MFAGLFNISTNLTEVPGFDVSVLRKSYSLENISKLSLFSHTGSIQSHN